MTMEKLPTELVWEGAHVSELGLTAMADGQESILGESAVEHVEGCERCTGRLGRIALTSSAVGEALADARAGGASAAARAMTAAGTSPSPSPRMAAPAPRPGRALTVGVAVAVLAAVPTLHDALRAPALASTLTTHAVKALVHMGLALATSDAVARGLPPATFIASALLFLMGWAIGTVARSVSRGATIESEGS
jgi:hypothetical protein